MVNLNIYVEGGVLPHANIAAQTVDNSEKLRESFYTILSQIIDANLININVELCSSNNNTIKVFKSAVAKSKNQLLLIDLDTSNSEKAKKLESFELEEYAGSIFFMVQKMEAWILSQPEMIDQTYSIKYIRNRISEKIADDENLKDRHPEDITHPDRVLDTIIQKYFEEERRGKKKKKKYGKLKDAPELLAMLNAKKLLYTFTDLTELQNFVDNMQQ